VTNDDPMGRSQPPPSSELLNAYVAENAGKYTDEAMYEALVKAGHPPDDVRAAIASASSHLRPQTAAPRAIRAIVIAYIAVFALLSVGMLLNTRATSGPLMPTALGGIGILAASLFAAFLASLVWLASRRIFIFLILLMIGGYGLGALAQSADTVPVGIVTLVLVAGGVILVFRTPKSLTGRGETALAVLMAVPILLLLGVAGICVASGLPIPGAA
jgi:hypothetical protein